MARLSAACLALFAAATAAAPAQEPPRSLAQRRMQQAAVRLAALPPPQTMPQRQAVFALLLRLEHAPAAELAPHWDRLAAFGTEPDLGNRILYARRHALALPEPVPGEGAASALERALAFWGEDRAEEAAAALAAGVQRFPDDPVFAQNLDWLQWRVPAAIDPRAGARMSALAVLAARRSAP